jgi:hypothetical protein
MRIELPEEQWRQVLAILAQASWQAANPLIMEIGQQMQAQATGSVRGPPNSPGEGIHVPDEPNARQRPS